MLSIIVAVICGAVSGGIVHYSGGSIGWSVTAAVIAFGIVYIAIGLFVFAKVKQMNSRIQNLMQEGSRKLNRRMQQMQLKPQGGVKAMQQTLEREQKRILEQAIELTGEIEPFFKWNLMLKKQITTMRMMFYYQMKNFEEVDRLLPDCMVFADPRALAMKIARQFVNKDPELEKSLTKLRRFKGDSAALLYSLAAWIRVKQGKNDDALKILVEAKSRCDSEVINRNWEALANGNIKKFSNAPLGDAWYSLHLEEPKIKTKKARRGRIR